MDHMGGKKSITKRQLQKALGLGPSDAIFLRVWAWAREDLFQGKGG